MVIIMNTSNEQLLLNQQLTFITTFRVPSTQNQKVLFTKVATFILKNAIIGKNYCEIFPTTAF